MQQYSLGQHVYICVTRDYAVLLDVKTNAYFGLSREHMEIIGPQLRGWQQSTETESGNQPQSAEHLLEAHATIRRLVDNKILTSDPRTGKDVAPAAIETPTAALIDTIFINTLDVDEAVTEPIVRLRDAWFFLVASVAAAVMKRWWSLDRIVRHLQQRRQSVLSQGDVDIEKARELVWIFRKIRPFLFSKKSACFFESLVLLEFLAHYGIFPAWVFGIQTAPFQAHCWVQAGSVVFNDSPYIVRPFMPIMAT